MIDELVWTGDPETQQYEPWLKAAMLDDGKAMPSMWRGVVCLALDDGGPVIYPGEVITRQRLEAAPRWFSHVAKQKAPE